MTDRWIFEQNDEQQWTWTCVDSAAKVQSENSFTQCVDCMLDAVRYTVQRRRSTSYEAAND